MILLIQILNSSTTSFSIMSQDQILCISYFDQIMGPSTLYSSEILSKSLNTPNLDRILEFNDEEGTFIFAYRKYQTVNHLFYIDSDLARGGKELLMITYMIRAAIFKDEIVDVFKYLDSKEPILEDFASELKDLKDIPSILHLKKSAFSEEFVLELANEDLKTNFLEIFNRYFKRLVPKFQLDTPIRGRSHLKKVFILGAPQVGKTTLLKNIELIQFLNVKRNDLPSRIYEVLVENIEVLKYNDELEEFACKEYENLEKCTIMAQAFILLFNLSDKNSIYQTKEIFQIVDDKRLEIEKDPIPILIIGNKFHDKEEFQPDFIHKIFEIEKFRELGVKIKYYALNILTEDEKIMKLVRWIIKQIV